MSEEEEMIRSVMRVLGSRKSEKKTEASRENGKKGGRPPGMKLSEETKAKMRQAQIARREKEATETPTGQKRGTLRGRPKREEE